MEHNVKEIKGEKGKVEVLLYHLALHYRWKLPCLAPIVCMSVQWMRQALSSQKGFKDAALDTSHHMVNSSLILQIFLNSVKTFDFNFQPLVPIVPFSA